MVIHALLSTVKNNVSEVKHAALNTKIFILINKRILEKLVVYNLPKNISLRKKINDSASAESSKKSM